ncbi:glycerol-3-phosphate dehydrogenase [soil metagenome]
MDRDLGRLADEEFDVIVAGGGVYALTVAQELASRDLRVAILERNDFAGATSFNSLKTIHGGIRALQHGALGELRQFVQERRAFARLAPHLVRPLPFIVPTYRHPIRNRAAMALFLAVYNRLARGRNDGVDPSRVLPRSRTVGRAECLRLNPAIDPAGVTGGAIWHDYQLHSPERFAMALLRSACEAGAAAANYVQVTSFLIRDGAVFGVRAHDALSKSELEIRGRVIVNATGPWAWDVLTQAGLTPSAPAPTFSLAMNIVVSRPPLSHAVGGLAGGRFLFMVPWRDRSIIGTSHEEYTGSNPAPETTADRLRRLLQDAATALPGAAIGPADIRLVHRGLLPSVRTHRAEGLAKRSLVHDHRQDGVRGLLTVVGVRYTTAGATAREAADRACALLGRRAAARREARRPLAGGDIPNLVDYERHEIARSGLPAGLVRRLIAGYGTGYAALAERAASDPCLSRPLAEGCAVTGAEIEHAVRHEMAVHLGDALLRRTEAGTAGHPGPAAVTAAAAIMGKLLSWTPARVDEEIAAVDAFYAMS